ncbi:MAG: hypothetical protein NXI08_09535 [bacterium]|nr:hypothetical protein [bacterium]
MKSRLKRIRFFLLSLVIATGTSLHVQSQNVVLSTDTDSVSVGDVISLNLKIQLNQSADELLFPDSSSFPPDLTYLDLQRFQLTDFADSLRYRVQYFANQDVYIPGFPIGVVTGTDTTTLYSNSLTIPFRSILPTKDAELKPIKPILPFDRFPWAVLLIILVLIAAAIWAYLTFTKKEEPAVVQKIVQPIPFQSPVLQLEQTLVSLKEDYNLSQTKDFKYFYSTISDSIRRYFEDLYEIPALESTSREVLRYLDAFGVDHEMIQSTRNVLNRSDMVKFAKFTPTLDSAWNTYAEAMDFLERAKLIDASRVARKKSEYEAQWEEVEPSSEAVEDEEPKVEAN